ncbi:hypothetical protein F5Y05DRAFT_412076 [Hypoxylon sp. FL0543]|nr:hypothetical protein F5Y05DRAFT_412076 [Hypoxylon sp. FL0543]
MGSVSACDPGWKSDDRGQLDLQPAARWTGYNYTNFTLPDFYGTKGGNSSWSGNIIQDQHDKKLLHLLVDQFAQGCGLSGWRPFSTVVRAESRTGPAGPYHCAEELMGTFVTIDRYAGYMYIVQMGPKTYRSPVLLTSEGHGSRQSVSSTQPTQLHGRYGRTTFSTPEMVLDVKDNFIYQADISTGPYNAIKSMPWNTSDYSNHWSEDSVLWRDKRGNWHILCHWMIDIADRHEKYTEWEDTCSRAA